MPAPDRQLRLTALRDIIADIERKPALAEAGARAILSETGFPQLPGGTVQDIFLDETRDAGAGLGFALMQARALLAGKRSAVLHLHLAPEGQALGLPYGPGLEGLIDPTRLVLVQARNAADLLWAAEEALSCQAVAAVIADMAARPKLLDFTATRRLSLRAGESGASLFFLHYGSWRQASAAQMRWRLTPERSAAQPYDDQAPGAPRWRLRLERGTLANHRTDWLLQATEKGLATLSTEPFEPNPAPAALSHALPAPLGHRLSQTA
ncbi:MAG: hypothetical protein KIS86_02555 [Devosia sp.]|nr:hypothetical protein [Devosia sp.]